MSEFYDFTAKDISGNEFSFKQLREKVVLIVNTASKCGFTPQYDGLQTLYDKYGEKGFVILGFPSNDFLLQEPGLNDEIKNFCRINYGVNFPLFEKVHVRGSKANPLFKFLVKGAGDNRYKGAIKWNFTKFLFDRKGNIIERFSPATKPEAIENKIKELLGDA